LSFGEYSLHKRAAKLNPRTFCLTRNLADLCQDDTKLSSLKVSPGQSILVLGVADADAMDVVDEDLSHHPLRQPGAGVKLEQFSNLFVALPREIQHVVLSHLPAATVAAAMRVCREWRAIVEHPLVWRHLFVSAFPFAPMARQFAARWREQYLGVLRAARAFKKKQFVELTIRTTTHSTAMSMHFSAVRVPHTFTYR
jgi:hypothetical protein